MRKVERFTDARYILLGPRKPHIDHYAHERSMDNLDNLDIINDDLILQPLQTHIHCEARY